MQREAHTSCIKINGISLLPPLMTDAIKEEMNRYKTLAVKVEEKLRVRQLAKCTIKDVGVQADIIKPSYKLRSSKYSSDSDASNYNTTSDTNNSDSHSKITIVEDMRVAEETIENNAQSRTSNIEHMQFKASSTSDATVDDTRCVDINSLAARQIENKPAEEWKPSVPRTLDIVPIILKELEKKEKIPIFSTTSKKGESPPKLSRQGSYVLDTPSPILLAHMHTELADNSYVPTPTVNTPQRKQWDITQRKTEWENERLVAQDAKASDERTTPESDIPAESYRANESTDSANAVLVEEHARDITPTEHNHKPNTDPESTNLSNEEKSREDGTLHSTSTPSDRGFIPKELLHSSQDIFKRHEDDVGDKEKERQEAIKEKSIASEKLLTVYKEIEEMHRKQMMELIDRQRKEQSFLQEEFQKQQMLLLVEIQKCASELSYRADDADVALSKSTSSSEIEVGDTISEARQELNINSFVNLQEKIYSNSKLSNHADVVICPLDYVSSKHMYLPKYHKSPSLMTDSCPAALGLDFTKKINLRDAASNNNNSDNDDTNSNCEPHIRTVYRSSTVNRQLFPLDSNTTHVPATDTSVYLEKHVRAMNIINAYARGYLVRRLMRTERVIMLKKTYKEALQCMLKLHVDAPLNLAEVNFLHRLQLQCDAASMNLVELFSQPPAKRMKIIAQDREMKQSRSERSMSARSSYSFATQKTLARRNLKEFESTMTKYQRPLVPKKNIIRSRCQTWTSDIREKPVLPNTLHPSIRRSTSTGTVRKPWR